MADGKPDRSLRVPADRLAWREIDGEIVALDLDSSTYFSANRSASVLLRALVRGASRRELSAALVAQYELTHERADSDVDDFLRTLERHGLLEGSDG